MKEKLRNKKVVYTIIGIVSVLLVALAVTYAYWLVTKTQTGENEITSGCLDITISGEKNDINLTNEFPMSDEEGMKLVPYEFTVTNNCNTSVDYQVALEATGTEESAMATSSLKVALNDSVSLLSSKAEVATTISGAYESRVLGYSRLAASGNEGSSATYKLRIWIDEEAPISEMNKTFTSKISVTVGQGLESPYEEGTLAYDILANYSGVNATSEIDVNELDHRITLTSSLCPSTSLKWYYGTEYTFNEGTGKYKLSGDLVQATLGECRSGTKTCGKYTLKNASSTYSSSTLYEITDFKSSGSCVPANEIQYVNAFEIPTKATEAGIYKTLDDYGTSYYFRGDVDNNYVHLGSHNEEIKMYHVQSYDLWYDSFDECVMEIDNGAPWSVDACVETILANENDPMYWRIVRINGNGTIRLVYDGTSAVINDEYHLSIIGRTSFNTNYDNGKYVGYTYDTSDNDKTQVDSTIKGVLETWYTDNLESEYGNYIADSIFCNDRENINSDNYFDSYDRLSTNKIPSLKCTNKSDRYTVDDIVKGNGLLTKPIGLMTADEEVFAGAASNQTNKSYYLYNGASYWISTPYDCLGGNGAVWYVNDAYLTFRKVNTKSGVRPVINLKADVEFTGDGTIDNPYKIVTE